MSNYAITYYGEPNFTSQEAGSQYKAKWTAWADSIGAAWVIPATPLGMSKVISGSSVSDGAKPNRLTGFSTVKADSLDAAIEMAKRCPHLEFGTIEVSEVYEM